jgi:hypothetical protein
MRADTMRALADAMAGIGYGMPAWESATTEADLAMDAWVRSTLELEAKDLARLATLLAPDHRRSLYRYSVRAASRATSVHDEDRCRLGLAAAVLAVGAETDPRDLMVNFAPHHVACSRLEGSASRLFDWAAGRMTSAETRASLEAFGRRVDVTLQAFSWREEGSPRQAWYVLTW